MTCVPVVILKVVRVGYVLASAGENADSHEGGDVFVTADAATPFAHLRRTQSPARR